MTWHILGAGSLGTLWAVRLARSGCPVRLILRNQARLEAYQAAGGVSLTESNRRTHWPLPAQLPETNEPISHLLIASKAYDAEAAAASVAHRLQPGAQVVLLQNGLGSQQAVARQLPQQDCIFASSTEGAYRQADFDVVLAGAGQTWLGHATSKPAPSWLDALSAAGIAHQWTTDILSRLWRKLALNCAINPLTVLKQCRNGELENHDNQVRLICTDLVKLLEHQGLTEAAHALYPEVNRVINATAQNFSSMYQDVANGRRTEIAYLSGYACQVAQNAGLTLEHLNAVHQRLLEYLTRHGLPTH